MVRLHEKKGDCMEKNVLLKKIEAKLGAIFESKEARRVNSGIDSAEKKLELFVKNGYAITGELKNILSERNKKIIESTSF